MLIFIMHACFPYEKDEKEKKNLYFATIICFNYSQWYKCLTYYVLSQIIPSVMSMSLKIVIYVVLLLKIVIFYSRG